MIICVSHGLPKATALELASTLPDTRLPTPVTLTVKLKELGLDDAAMHMDSLGTSQLCRFNRLGDVSDLENAITNTQNAVELTDESHPDKPWYLSNHSICQLRHFERLGHLSDLENAISNIQKAVNLTNDGHPDRPKYFSNLGNSLLSRFERLGDLSDLENAISNQRKAIDLIDDGHPDQPAYFSNLGISHETRFKHLGNLSDLENAISNQQKAVDLTDDGHPNKAMRLSNLGISLLYCFERLGDLSSLKNAISNQQKAVDRTDDGHPNQPMYFSNLGVSQKTLFERLGDLSDLENAISNTQKAVDLTDDGHPDQPGYFSNLGNSLLSCFERLGDLLDLEIAILNQQKAVDLIDDGHPRKAMHFSNLGISQFCHFERLGNLSDLDNAILNQRKAIDLIDDGHPDQPQYFSKLGISLLRRFEHLGDFSDLKNAILSQRTAVDLTDDGHPDKPMHFSNLGVSQKTRYERLGDLSDVENAIANKQKAVDLTDDRHPDQPGYFCNLGNSLLSRFERLGDLSNLENAILNQQKAVDLVDDGHPDQPVYFSKLGSSQQTRFERLGALSNLENAVLNHQKAVDLMDDGHLRKGTFLLSLGASLQIRFHHVGDPDDLAFSVLSYKASAQLKAGYPSVALHAARQWAQISHQNGDLLSALDGYRAALELFSKVAWLGLNTHSRRATLLQEKAENLGCLAATCAIQLGHLEEAVELLDLGRSIFWQQASSLRSDLEMLREQDAELIDKFERTGQQLDNVNFYGSYFIVEEHNAGVNWQRRAEETESEYRQLLPQFESFLKPIPFHQLRQASMVGQVITINTSTYGVDALIFGATRPIEHMSLPNINHEALAELSKNIVLNQPSSGSETQRRHHTTWFLKPALRIIWNDILADIFDKIHILPVNNTTGLPQHRIWWYLTGPLTFIPVHTAGPGCGATDVSQLVISSYVTTLESLFRAQKKNVPVSRVSQMFLCVSQPETPGQTPLPQTMEEVDNVVQIFCSSGWSKENIVCLSGTDATMGAVSSALDSCSWVHLACHAFQDSKRDMRSAFALHNGHLELGEIASKRLPEAQFAFLSACQAASGQKDLLGEAMHLAAGLQFAGFPSVIATLWRIRDVDAPKVAAHAYQFLLRSGLEGLDPSDAASALNHAILHLREDPSVTVDQWAPFVHFGI
ncbi:hypothetical protein PILCRDRAFT_794197 [Piloderma croceum F 1598]|uniref:CHAT domain-containing protein n=1 Tax=Piloderma croceum (strain F 1598) TaxID=765440 RepID=A0A0C3FEG3_PILCF|nr:hypothetical protein PILCRDRAFT_794197 [Piloderma croceum F 1598]